MAKRGRIGNNKPVITEENQAIADEFLKTMGKHYEAYRRSFEKYGYPEDTINTTILYCYEAIQRNGLKDTTEQGQKNYFFRAYNTNVRCQQDPYKQRKDDNVEPVKDEIEETAEEKFADQLYRDYATLYLIKAAEQQFDKVDFWCFRIKHLVPKTSYEKLRQITGIKDCKRRVVSINRWLKENITNDEIRESFQMDFPDFQN